MPSMPPALRPLGTLLLPLAVLALAALLLEPASHLDLTTRRLLVYLPYALLLATAGLAHYFNRSRELACALLLICAYWLIRARLQTPLAEPVPQAIYALIGVVVPVAILLQFLATERGLWTPRSLRLVLFGPALLLLGVLVYGSDAARAERLVAWFPAKPLSGYVLSPGASAFFGAALAAMLALMALRQARLQPALPGALACVFCALAFFHVPLISTLMFCAAAVILVAGVLQSTHEMAYRDPLTGLLGRRALEERLLGLGPRYTLAMLDVDHFKRFNDTHGHEAGDEALKMVAKHLERVGGGGTAYRYGGEEFCIVFPRRGLAECKPHLERLRGAIEEYPLTLRDTARRPEDSEAGARRRGAAVAAANVSVTISVGLAEPDPDDDTPEQVLRTADRALYAAKEGGRNRIAYFPGAEADA
ncbi:MAG: GGDEF domain-containing protein [Halofilum sp. (in: g-proteobacteria)]|nr:GGDEF domain-containing protein [Halofilum sp. (in: g-proteobacteria)]